VTVPTATDVTDAMAADERIMATEPRGRVRHGRGPADVRVGPEREPYGKAEGPYEADNGRVVDSRTADIPADSAGAEDNNRVEALRCAEAVVHAPGPGAAGAKAVERYFRVHPNRRCPRL